MQNSNEVSDVVKQVNILLNKIGIIYYQLNTISWHIYVSLFLWI